MLKINRDYYANVTKVIVNPIITNIANVNNDYFEKCKNSGYLPPETFTLLAYQGLIQNEFNVPTIYHWSRHNSNKKIPHNVQEIPPLKYSTALPDCNTNSKQRLHLNKYWWLNENSMFINEIRKRTRKKSH